MLFSPYDLQRGLSLGFGLLFGSVGPLLGILSYVLTALALYTIARRRGISNPWLAWLPVADTWLLGSLSDQYRYVARGQEKHKRIWLLALNIAMVLMMPLLVVFANLIGNIGGWVVAHYYAGIGTFTYTNSIKMLAEFYDVFGGMLKSCVFGAIIAIVGCYKGLNAPNGAEGVGLATTASVVLSIILIFIFNYFLSIVIYV